MVNLSLDISLGQISIATSIIGAVLYLHRTMNGVGLLVWQHRVMWEYHRRHHTLPEFPNIVVRVDKT